MSLNQTELQSQYNQKTDEELLQLLKNLQQEAFSAYDVDGKKAENLTRQKIVQNILTARNVAYSSPSSATSQYGTNSNYQPQSNSYSSESYGDETESRFNVGQIVLGALLLLGGIVISMMSEGSIFYGLMIVGLITMVRGFMN